MILCVFCDNVHVTFDGFACRETLVLVVEVCMLCRTVEFL